MTGGRVLVGPTSLWLAPVQPNQPRARVEDALGRPPLPEFDPDTVGPAVGTRFPDVVLPDQRGVAVDFHHHRNGRRALFVVYRSAAW